MNGILTIRSMQIGFGAALAVLPVAVTDLDVVHGVININKARVAGINRSLTKTGNDRRVELCTRALAVLKRQLRLRTQLVNLQFPQVRWRRTLTSLKLRYRRPYVARHS